MADAFTTLPPMGWVESPRLVAALIERLPFQTLAQAGPEIMSADDDTDFFLFENEARYIKQFLDAGLPPPWPTDKIGQTTYFKNPHQLRGDCTSHGAGGGIEALQLTRIMLRNINETFNLVSSEALYGGAVVTIMGWRGDHGAYTGAPLEYAIKHGFLARKVYGEGRSAIDLTRYDGDKALQYCKTGVPSTLLEPQKQHTLKTIVPVKNFEEARALVRQGYPLSVGSNQGFTTTRDKDGFCRPSGTWAHCTAFVGTRGGRRPGMAYRQSWGPKMPDGPKTIILDDGRELDLPEGIFFVEPEVFNKMCRSEAFALSDSDGFPALDNKFY